MDKEAYFADDIVPRMLDFFIKRPHCRSHHLKITLVGGAEAKNERDKFRVGPRNLEVIEGILKDYKLNYDKEETLGRFSRSVDISVDDGSIRIKKNKMLL